MQKQQRNVYIENRYPEYSMLFIALGYTVVNDLDRADLVCFTGGSDVSPDIYGDAKHRRTYNDEMRDIREEEVFKKCLNKGIPMVGICRGGQFLNVMSGGRMYQDVTKHCHSHFLIDVATGREVWVSSTHHQMMMPGSEAILIAYAAHSSEREWFDKDIPRSDTTTEGVEVLFYPQTKCLCFQPHPEFSSHDYQEMKEYFDSLIKKFLFGD